MLCDWIFDADLPYDAERTSIGQLLEEVRRQAALDILRECRESGLEVSEEDVSGLADDSFMEGSRGSREISGPR